MKKLFPLLAFAFVFTACASSKEMIVPLTKDAPSGESNVTVKLELKEPPLVGTTPAGQKLYLGGFSGLRYLGKNPEGKLRFLTVTDRGPNADEIYEGKEMRRPFLLPGYQPRLVFLEADPLAGTLKVEKEILLRRPDGKKLSGIPQAAGQEVPLDSLGKKIPLDPYGMDLEGATLASDGSYWLVEEYGPTVVRFSADGKMLETLKPGKGLPKILEQRRLNRGFEGAALQGQRLYSVMQSPLDNPVSADAANSKNGRAVRIVEVDLAGKRTLGQFVYVLEPEGTDRIGDIALETTRTLLVLEHDGKPGKKSTKKVFRAKLEKASNLQLLQERVVGPGGSLETTPVEKLSDTGVFPVSKEEVADLKALGVSEDKVEGIDLLEDGRMAILVDNDFGLDGSWDSSNGKVGFKDQNSALYLIPAGMWKRLP